MLPGFPKWTDLWNSIDRTWTAQQAGPVAANRARASFAYWQSRLAADDPRKHWQLSVTKTGWSSGQDFFEYAIKEPGKPSGPLAPERTDARFLLPVIRNVPIPPVTPDAEAAQRLAFDDMLRIFRTLRARIDCFDAPASRVEAIRQHFHRWKQTIPQTSPFTNVKLVRRTVGEGTDRYWLDCPDADYARMGRA